MSDTTTLVELCAGSAAVSTRAIGNRYPIVTYQGGKGKWAKKILAALEIEEPPDRVVLVEPGVWADTWLTLTLPEARWLVSWDMGQSYTERRARWWHRNMINRSSSVLDSDDGRASDHLTLQAWNFGHKAVYIQDGQWVTHGFNKSSALGTPATPRFGGVKPQHIQTAKKLRAAKNFDRIEVIKASALDVEPIPGARVYIDPPYQGTTGYGAALSREEVLGLAARWADAGCLVAVSEAEPLPMVGSLHLEIGARKSGALSKRTHRPEWLTVLDGRRE